MIDIKINITNKIANAIGTPFIVCGNSDYTVTFTFDAEWGAYQEKTARFFFVSDGIEQYIDVLFSGNTCNAPVLPNIEKVLIGVYTGNLRTTTGAEVRCKRSILFGGKVHEPPTTEDVYNEILEIVSKKLGSEGGTVTGDYYKDGNTFIHEGNLELIEPKINEVLASEKLVETATGSAITIESAKAPLQNLKLYGKTTQDGTPTPDAPIELKSVGDSGSFMVGVYGKNLFDIGTVSDYFNTSNDGARLQLTQNISDTTTFSITDNTINIESYNNSGYRWISKWLKIIPNTDYTISIENIGGLISVVGLNSNENGTIGDALINKNQVSNTVKSVKFNSGNYKYYIISFYPSNAGVTFKNIQIELGTQATPYEEFKGKQTLTMPYTLRGMGDIKDEVDFTRGVRTERFLYKRVTNVIDGYVGSNGYYIGVIAWNGKGVNNNAFANVLCNIAERITTNGQYGNTSLPATVSISVSNGVLICVKGITTKSDLDNYLANNEVYVLYESNQPIETPIPETELNAYRHLMTNKGNTTILSECEDTEITYYVNKPNAQAIGSLHEQINKDYLKLQQAIISTGGSTL